MSSVIDYAEILARHDALAAQGILNWSPPTVVQLEDDGFRLTYHITTTLRTKAQWEHTVIPPTSAESPRTFGPGSDIAYPETTPSIVLTHVGLNSPEPGDGEQQATHILVLNKYPVFRPQLLLLTSDSHCRQTTPLTVQDISALCETLIGLSSRKLTPDAKLQESSNDGETSNTEWMAIYNCGPKAGASRRHKHVQIIPRPLRLFADERNYDAKSIPYRHFVRYLSESHFTSEDGRAEVFHAYQKLLVQAKHAAEEFSRSAATDNDGHFPHNVVVVREWLMVIPRGAADVHGITANAAGMVGSVWLANEGQLARWKEVGPRAALAGLGIPNMAMGEVDR